MVSLSSPLFFERAYAFESTLRCSSFGFPRCRRTTARSPQSSRLDLIQNHMPLHKSLLGRLWPLEK